MKKVFGLLLAVGGLFAYQNGQVVDVYLNHFRLFPERDTIPNSAVVVHVGTYSAVAIMYEHHCTGITTDTVLAATDSSDSAFYQMLADSVFAAAEYVIPQILDRYGVEWDEIKPDSGQLLYIVAPLFGFGQQTSKLSHALGLVPFLGYFDPFDLETQPDTNLAPNGLAMAVIQANTPQNYNYSRAYPKGLAGYLFAQYMLYKLDPNDERSYYLGLAAWIGSIPGDTTGYDLIDGFFEGRDFGKIDRNQETSYTETSLFKLTSTNVPTYPWKMNPIITSENDRERFYAFYAYVEEQLGLDFLKTLIRSDKKIARYDIEEAFMQQTGEDFYATVEDFYVNVWLHGLGVEGYGLSLLPSDKILFNKPLYLNQTTDFQQQLEPWACAIFQAQINLPTSFFADFRAKTVIGGQERSPFVVYVFDSSSGTISKIDLEADEFYVDLGRLTRRSRILVLNLDKENSWYYVIGYTNDPPIIHDLIAIQNPVVDKFVDVYLITQARLYGGANPSDDVPVIRFEPADTNYLADSTELDLWVDARPFIYTASRSLELTDEFDNPYSGDIYVRVSRAYSVHGTPAEFEDPSQSEDTITVLSIGPEGGVFSAIGGKVSLKVPEGAFGGARLLISKASGFEGLVPEGEGVVYSIGRRSLLPARPITITLATEGYQGLWHYKDGEWVPVEAYLSSDGSYITATVDELGFYLVGAPNSRPGELSFYMPTVLRGEGKLFFSLPQDTKVRVVAYDASGKKLGVVYDGLLKAGKRLVTWDLKGSSGVVFYKVQAGTLSKVLKAVQVK